MNAFSIREATNEDASAARRIVFAVLAEYGLAPDPAGTDRDLEDIEGNYQGRGGTFRVVESPESGVVGCGGLFRISAEEVELRKMYLLPEARGYGVGKQMLREFVDVARNMGAARLTLETASVLREAIGMYESHGFARVAGTGLAARCDQVWELTLRSVDPCRRAPPSSQST